MSLARDRANMDDVRRLLRVRASQWTTKSPTPEALADSLSCESFRGRHPDWMYDAVSRFRSLRQDARVAAARQALAVHA